MSTVLAELGNHQAWLAGDLAAIRRATSAAKARRSWDRRRRAFVISASDFDDVRAALELQMGADVRLVQVIT